MFIEVPSLKKAKKQAFERIKHVTGYARFKAYPITDNLVYVIKEGSSSEQLKIAKLVKKLMEKEENFIVIGEDGRFIDVIKKGKELKLFRYEKDEKPLVSLFSSVERQTGVYYIENKKLEELINRAENLFKQAFPEKASLLSFNPVRVIVKDEDVSQLITETNFWKQLKQTERKFREMLFQHKKELLISVFVMLAVLIGYYGYSVYKRGAKNNVERRITMPAKRNHNKEIVGYLIENLPAINFISTSGKNFEAVAKNKLAGTKELTKSGNLFIVKGSIPYFKASFKEEKQLLVSPVYEEERNRMKKMVFTDLTEDEVVKVLSYFSRNSSPLNIMLSRINESYFLLEIFLGGTWKANTGFSSNRNSHSISGG